MTRIVEEREEEGSWEAVKEAVWGELGGEQQQRLKRCSCASSPFCVVVGTLPCGVSPIQQLVVSFLFLVLVIPRDSPLVRGHRCVLGQSHHHHLSPLVSRLFFVG